MVLGGFWRRIHEIVSLIPWHKEYMHGDDKSTLSPECHEIIEAEANYGGGRLLFPHQVFSEARQSSTMSLSLVKAIATSFGNTITSSLWRCVEQSEQILFAAIGGHPHHPKNDVSPIQYLIGLAQARCRRKSGGPDAISYHRRIRRVRP